MYRSVLKMVVLSIVTLAPALVSSQSLADTAKKEQQRRKNAQPAASGKKIYTESDLSGSGSAPGTAAETGTPKPSSESTQGDAQPATPVTAERSGRAPSQTELENAWRARAAEAIERVEAAEEHLRSMETSRSGGVKIKTCVIPDSVVRQGEAAQKNFPCPDKWESQLDAARRQLQEAKAALSAMEERGRREGVPASWLR